MKRDEFYTDLNLINLPIFSSSKKIKSQNKTEKIQLEKNNIKTNLIITYPNEKLSFFDRKVLATIEYLYCKKFDFNNTKKLFEEIQENVKLDYCKKNKIKEKDLSLADEQTIIINSLENLSYEHRLYIDFKLINKFLSKTYLHSKIKKSLLKISETSINYESDYIIDGSKIQFNQVLLNAKIVESENTKNKKNIVSISLNPFHLYNLIYNYNTKSDLNFLNSFESSIGGRLSELLRKSIYGSKNYNKSYVVYEYTYICNYLQIEKFKSLSRIIQQIENPFKELIAKNIIVNYRIEKNLFGDYEVYFYHSFDFYKDYFESLDKDDVQKINNKIREIIKDENIYKLLQNSIDDFFLNSKISSEEERKEIEPYYRYYIILKDFL